ncbi:MAG TPA: hypothetical protein VGX71_18590 [Pseudaminobacter sp.]|nr:hypothetical protein [Pseudaminobacter sp.]
MALSAIDNKVGNVPVLSGEAFSAQEKERIAWHRDFNRNPALCFQVESTAGVLTEKLASFDISQVKANIAESGITAMVHGKRRRPVRSG